MKVRVCEVLRDKVLPALKAGRKKYLQKLLSTALTEARSPLMEADEGDDHRDHMYRAMRASEDAGNEEAAAGIHKLLHPAKRVEEEDESEEDKEDEEEEEGGEEEERSEMEGEGVEGPGEPGEHNEGPDGKGGPGTAFESRRRKKKLRPGEVRLTEGRALQLCQSAGIEATADVMEAMKGADFDQALRIVKLAKRGQARTATAPRSTGPLRESAQATIPKDLKSWAESLKG